MKHILTELEATTTTTTAILLNKTAKYTSRKRRKLSNRISNNAHKVSLFLHYDLAIDQ